MAAADAKQYVTDAIMAADELTVGKGHGRVHHSMRGGEQQKRETPHEHHTTQARFRCRGVRPRRRTLRGARASAALAHGDVVAQAPAGARTVGRACRGAHRCDVRRAAHHYNVSARGEVVPAFGGARRGRRQCRRDGPHGVVSSGRARCRPAVGLPRPLPFGLTPAEHVAWVEAGGGRALWDDLYKPFGVKPFMGGNTGVCMGGWFRRDIKSLDDWKGLKIRSLGLGGEVYRRLARRRRRRRRARS